MDIHTEVSRAQQKQLIYPVALLYFGSCSGFTSLVPNSPAFPAIVGLEFVCRSSVYTSQSHFYCLELKTLTDTSNATLTSL